MNESIFIAVIGIVGTLAGTVLGWLLNNISRHGELKGFVVKWDEKFELNETGLMVFAPSFDKAEVYSSYDPNPVKWAWSSGRARRLDSCWDGKRPRLGAAA